MTPAIDIARIAHALGGAVRDAMGWRCRCPVHDGEDSNLKLWPGDTVPLLAKCWSRECDPRDILAELRRRGLLDDRRRETLFQVEPTGIVAAQMLAAMPPVQRIDALLKLSRPVVGTCAEKYLIGRGLDPGLVESDALRVLPAMGRYPATMIAVVTAFSDVSRVLGLQFTPLKPDGSRGQRTFLRGSKVGGGVVRLIDDAEVTLSLGLAEGVESALSVMTSMKRANRIVLPVWSALSAGNLSRLPVLPTIEKLSIYSDSDKHGIGQKAALTLATRWHAAGREVYVAQPPAPSGAKRDWNE